MEAHPVTRLGPYRGLNSSKRDPSTTRASTSRGSKGTRRSADAIPSSSSGSWTGSSPGIDGGGPCLCWLSREHDGAPDADGVGLVGGQVVGQTAHPGVHGGAAQFLVV